jgi:hypothetical protein
MREAFFTPLHSDHPYAKWVLSENPSAAGEIRRESRFEAVADGRVLVSESTWMKGSLFERYEITNQTTSERGSVERIGDHVVIEYGKIDSRKLSRAEEKFDETMVLPTTLPDFVKTHWTELLAGRPVDLRFILLERTETIGFTLRSRIENRERLELQMVASSIFIRIFAPRFTFIFDLNSRELKTLQGLTAIRIDNNGHLEQPEMLATFP